MAGWWATCGPATYLMVQGLPAQRSCLTPATPPMICCRMGQPAITGPTGCCSAVHSRRRLLPHPDRLDGGGAQVWLDAPGEFGIVVRGHGRVEVMLEVVGQLEEQG